MKRAPWTQKALESAMSAVENGTPILRAAKEHKIPRRTLRNHLKTGNVQRKLGCSTTLTQDQERELCQIIFELSKSGLPVMSKLLQGTVYVFCEINKIKHRFNTATKRAGSKWMRLFCQRHPNLKMDTRNLYTKRGRRKKLKETELALYNSQLEEALTELEKWLETKSKVGKCSCELKDC